MTSLAPCPLRGGSFRAPLASDVCFEGRRLSISLIWAGVFPRWFFIQLYRWFPSILKALTIIQPDTLVRWHRAVCVPKTSSVLISRRSRPTSDG